MSQSNDSRVTLGIYWAKLGREGRRQLASAAGFSLGYLEHVVAGRRRASRYCAIVLVGLSKGAIRPSSIRPDLWSHGATIAPDIFERMQAEDIDLERRISAALQAWQKAGESHAPTDRQRELAADVAELIREREDGVAVYLELYRARIGLADLLGST
jgi:hypothetical protein